MRPTTQQEADDDFQRAIAASQGQTFPAFGGYAQQESGIVGPGGGNATFGPANREFYESDKWAMVPAGSAVGAESSEIIPDVPPQGRVHESGPRLLKPLPGGDYTPNLLTICAAIDGVREALLMREHVKEYFGKDADWWHGTPIAMPKIVHVDDGRPAAPESDYRDEVLAEVQRLMALLTTSKREYGSAQALMQTDALKRSKLLSTSSRTALELFLQRWAVGAASKSSTPDEMTNLFNTTIGTNAAEGMETPDMSLIDMQIANGPGEKPELLEILDGLLWDTDASGATMTDNYIERPAEVLVMRVFKASVALGSELNVVVPEQFHVDKYLKENIEVTRATRAKMAKGKKRISKIEEIERKLKTWKHPKKSEQLDAGLLLKHTLGHFSGQNRIDVAKADKTNTAVALDEAPADPPHYAEITQKLEKVIASIDNKLLILAEEKEKTREAIRSMSKEDAAGLPKEDLKHHYTLRGVATKPNITYVLSPREADPDDIMFDDETSPQGFQWWRIDYEVNANGSGAKLTKTKTDDFDVLRAVELEHNSALLVYASDRINTPSATPLDLPLPLQQFIENDSALFTSELQSPNAHSTDPNPPAYNLMDDYPRQSIERNSMDSTRVEGADGSRPPSLYGDPSPPGYEDGGFMDHHGFGLGPDIKQGYTQMDEEEDGPVHEITLDDQEDGMDIGFGGGVEMGEKVHEPLIPGLTGRGNGSGVGSGDVGMRGAESQEGGRGDERW